MAGGRDHDHDSRISVFWSVPRLVEMCMPSLMVPSLMVDARLLHVYVLGIALSGWALKLKGTMMNSTQDPAVRDASGNVHPSEENDDAHYSFQQVKKGYVLVTRMESITAYKNQHGQHRSGTQEQPDTHVSANNVCALDGWPSHARRNRAQLQNVGMNYRSFKDDVVVIMKRKLPLIGTASTTGTLGTRHNVIAPNTLIQAATMNSRMFRAMDPKI
uniref:Uncharacterized protein n=1 Tax=Aegilops tauschii TaxID=37682 RepID=M8C784_AEGTA